MLNPSKSSSTKIARNVAQKVRFNCSGAAICNNHSHDKLWLSDAVFHDASILSAYSHLISQMQMSRPNEETRERGGEFATKITFGEISVEGSATTKKNSRKEAIRKVCFY